MSGDSRRARTHVHGRDVASSARVAVVGEALAHRYWPGENPIGKRFNGGGTSPYREVIGVAETCAMSTSGPIPSRTSTPRCQRRARQTCSLRSHRGQPSAPDGRRTRQCPCIDSRSRPRHIAWRTISLSGSGRRRWAPCCPAHSAPCLLLASAGIYAVAANAVTQRTREIAIRLRWVRAMRAFWRCCCATGCGWSPSVS